MSREGLGVAQANGITVAFRHWPAPAAAVHPPVVLLHGVLQSNEGMRHLAERLALDGEVLVPDLRGRGASDRPGSGYEPATMADDVAALVQKLGVDLPVVIGRLHGGLVAYYLAARYPGLLRGAILGDASPEVSKGRAERALASLREIPRRFASREDAERYYEDSFEVSAERARHDIPSDLEPAPDGGLRWRHDLDLVHRIESAAMPRSDWHVLARIRCPVLILRGLRGEIRPEVAARMLATMPGAQAQTIYGAGHDVFLGPGSEQTMAAIELFLHGLPTT